MGKTKKANYNKTKTTEIEVVQVTNNDQDGNSYTIYSMDKDQRWNMYNDMESFQKDPHEERNSKLERVQANKEKKKKQFIKNMNANTYNNQKLTNEQKMNPYNSKKAWYNNSRIQLPEEVYNASSDEEEDEDENEKEKGSEDELQDDEYRVHYSKNNKKVKILNDSDSDENSDEDSDEALEEGTHVIVTTKKSSKPTKSVDEEAIDELLKENPYELKLNNLDIDSKRLDYLFQKLEKGTMIKIIFNSMDLSPFEVEKLTNKLQKNKYIEEIGIISNHSEWKYKGAKGIADLLDKNHNLKILSLSGLNIPKKGYEKIMDSVGKNNRLTALTLTNNFTMRQHEIAALSQMVIQNQNLEYLDLSDNYLTNKTLSMLFRGIMVNKSVKHLVLSGNNMDESFTDLIYLIEQNSELHTLVLGRCISILTKDQLEAFSKALKTTQSLTHFDLRRSDLKKTFYDHFIPALKLNTSIQTLVLKSSYLDNESMKNLTECLSTNLTLTSLNVSTNYDITDHEIIQDLLLNSPNLREFNMEHHRFTSPNAIELLEKTFFQNQTLVQFEIGHDEEHSKRIETHLKQNHTIFQIQNIFKMKKSFSEKNFDIHFHFETFAEKRKFEDTTKSRKKQKK
eukprot:gene10291-2708_t